MPSPAQCGVVSSPGLRRELNRRALAFAERHSLAGEVTSRKQPSVLFSGIQGKSHGNFPKSSYQRICAEPAWAMRLQKPHSGWRRAWPRSDWQWRELDCAVSSDALLMSVFCYPGLIDSSHCRALLDLDSGDRPVFGVLPRLSRTRAPADATEIDMQIGDLFVEAKLTETGFQSAPPALVETFTNLRTVFEADRLSRTPGGNYAHYQLIRGALAASAANCRFCVLCDARRADMQEQWLTVMRAVRELSLRSRLMLLTWQELSAAVPRALQIWMAEKYGILPAVHL